MKIVNLVISTALLAATSLQASENANKLCSYDKSPAECQAYISGLVEGYVASKQNYLPQPVAFDSRYLERAFISRVGQNHGSLSKEPACLPKVVDKEKIVEHLVNSNSREALTEQLGDYLRSNYRCNAK